MKVDYSQEMKNIHNPVEIVNHKDLKRFDDESYWKRICTKCGGLLLVRRDLDTFYIMAQDNCVLCGQQYLYKDIEPLTGSQRELLAMGV